MLRLAHLLAAAVLSLASPACDRSPNRTLPPPPVTASASGDALPTPTAPPAAGASAAAGLAAIAVSELPPEGRTTLERIKAGGPFPHAKDGATFRNFEARLPRRDVGYYREYTVPTPGARDRGARRIVAGRGTVDDVRRSGEYYYTADHYATFRVIRE